MNKKKVFMDNGLENDIEYWLNGIDIVCISTYDLDIQTKHTIEWSLGYNPSISYTSNYFTRKLNSGKVLSVWTILDHNDVDWS